MVGDTIGELEFHVMGISSPEGHGPETEGDILCIRLRVDVFRAVNLPNAKVLKYHLPAMLDYKVLEENAIERRKELRRESNRVSQHNRRTSQLLWIAIGS
jgi:hypothetical protein